MHLFKKHYLIAGLFSALIVACTMDGEVAEVDSMAQRTDMVDAGTLETAPSEEEDCEDCAALSWAFEGGDADGGEIAAGGPSLNLCPTMCRAALGTTAKQLEIVCKQPETTAQQMCINACEYASRNGCKGLASRCHAAFKSRLLETCLLFHNAICFGKSV
jgi:hypothetical protein